MASNWIKRAFISSLLVVVFIAPFGSAIKCYQCQSKRDAVCGGTLPRDPSPSSEAHKFLVDCDKHANKSTVDPNIGHVSSTFCRKQHQEVDGNVNIIRACGFVKGDRECYSTANPPTKTQVCQCFEDGCNSAPGLPISALALPALACLMYYFRF